MLVLEIAGGILLAIAVIFVIGWLIAVATTYG